MATFAAARSLKTSLSLDGGACQTSFLTARTLNVVDDLLLLNEVVWRSVKGADSPMPAPVRAGRSGDYQWLIVWYDAGNCVAGSTDHFTHGENKMGKGNNSQKNDKKNKKPKKDKAKK